MTMQAAAEHLSQADFARFMGVSRAAVSQWKTKGILTDAAFTEPSKKGKVVVAVAVDEAGRNRDIGQTLGNGMETGPSAGVAVPAAVVKIVAPVAVSVQPELLGVAPVAPVAEQSPGGFLTSPADRVQEQLRVAKLEQQLRTNRMQAADEAKLRGMLMASDDAREQMARVASMMMQIFEGSLIDFASKIASQFDVPQRDVLHLLKGEFRNVRATAASKERARIADLDKETTASVELDA
jgi:predicted XRE-type DNA-binding protein